MTALLHHYKSGSGKPLVLLHGFLESSRMWENLSIPNGVESISIDLPGHGQSIEVSSAESMEEMARCVIDLIDEFGVPSYDVIGHSMGGYVALCLSSLDPRCAKVMLLNSNFWCDSAAKINDRKRVAEVVQTKLSHFIYEVVPNLFIDPEIHDQEVRCLIKDALKMAPNAVAASSIAMSKRKDLKSIIEGNPDRYSIVQGIHDPIVDVNRMRTEIQDLNVEYLELDNVGHMAHIEAPDAINKCVREFLVPVVVKNPN